MRQELLRKRFGQKVQLTFHCQIITPMFLGDAFQDAALRPEPFKGLLRYWWRVAVGRKAKDHEELLEEETLLFGGGGEKAQKSFVTVEVEGEPQIITSQNLPKVDNVRHPEVSRPVNPLLYLGYGPIIWQRGSGPIYNRFYFAPRSEFQIKISFPKSLWEDEDFKTAIKCFCAFGAVGSRSRNGWGSFQLRKVEPKELEEQILSHKIPCLWFNEKLFGERDYPHTLALDKVIRKPLLWRTKKFYETWQDVMKHLAEIYIPCRTSLPPDRQDDIDERHLLGFPLTHHPANRAPNWGPRARHASPLRFFVRKKKKGYLGFILHLPFGISKRMRRNASGKIFFTPNKQFEIWQKVHQCLDEAMQRASINECL